MWTQEKIKKLLMTNQRAVERAILAIYNRQTDTEKELSETIDKNFIGFSSEDARLGAYYAKWLLSGNRLTGKHVFRARMMALKYKKQLADIANSKRTSE